MNPVVALVGRPNVGKSTLFNRLTRSRDALVADQPGMTRDRKFGEGRLGDRPYIVVDTGGLSGAEEGIEALMATQVWLAVDQADVVVFLTDGREGLTPFDEEIAARLRGRGKSLLLVVNKAEGRAPELAGAEFHALGLGEPVAVSAVHGDGIQFLVDRLMDLLPPGGEVPPEAAQGVRIAIIGRPNAGKSTLLNRMLGEERVLASDLPGTTRDSIYVPLERDGTPYVLIDTAGVRRRRSVRETVEKFSVVKTLQAVKEAHVVVMVLDARAGISDQDASLLGFVLETGRALVLAVNKWDGLSRERRAEVRRELDLKLSFVDFATTRFISALHGTGVGELFEAVDQSYAAAMRELPTPRLTRLLEEFVAKHAPPMVRGRRIKLRYAHQGGHNPPVIVIHGNQTAAIQDDYRRYLINGFRRQLRLEGTPVRIEFRSGENPYEGRSNRLTPRQVRRRKRMLRHLKHR